MHTSCTCVRACVMRINEYVYDISHTEGGCGWTASEPTRSRAWVAHVYGCDDGFFSFARDTYLSLCSGVSTDLFPYRAIYVTERRMMKRRLASRTSNGSSTCVSVPLSDASNSAARRHSLSVSDVTAFTRSVEKATLKDALFSLACASPSSATCCQLSKLRVASG